MDHHPLRPVPADEGSAHALRSAIAATRRRLLDVLHARAVTLAAATTWVGPHRQRYEEDATQLLDAGRLLDRTLVELLVALDAEIDGVPR